MPLWASIVIPILVAIAAGLLGYILGLRRELRAAYLLAFEEWCSKLYGELVELKERYFDKEAPLDNPVLVITDYRDLHERLREAPRWRSKIEKENKVVADCLKELAELVDEGWHALQHRHNVNFQTNSLKGDWFEQIIREPKEQRQNISREIGNEEFPKLKSKLEGKKEVEVEGRKEEREIFQVIKEYLQSKVPRRF